MNVSRLLLEVCSLPTAPFAEQHVVRYVEKFVAKRPKLRLRSDRWGNLLIELDAKKKRARWVFAAHMDHPGLVARRMIDHRTLEADFRGWVHIDYVRNARVKFFDDGRESAGRVIDAQSGEHDRLAVPEKVKVRVASAVAPMSPGMFDLGAATLKKGKLHSRAIDDLAGVAGALAMLDKLHRNPPASPIAVLLTRAEEEGFIGAIAAVQKASLLRSTDRIIAIECSAMQPAAPQGAGAIIRVGDRTSIFDSQLTYFLVQQADELTRRDRKFKYQRALMPGGTCEATVYDVYGYTASSICVALGNYHNMDRARRRLAPEHIDVSDWNNMVKLFVQLARRGHGFAPGHGPLKKRISRRFRRLKRFLK